MRRCALYTFIIALLWLGFVCSALIIEFASGSSEAGINVDERAAGIVRLLSIKALLRAEIACCALCWFFLLRTRIVRERWAVAALAFASIVLAVQLLVTPSGHFMAMQLVKAVTLGVFSSMSVQAFARAVISE